MFFGGNVHEKNEGFSLSCLHVVWNELGVKMVIKKSSNKQIDYLILDKSFLKNKNIQNLKIKKYYYTIKTKSEFNKYNKKNNLIFENL